LLETEHPLPRAHRRARPRWSVAVLLAIPLQVCAAGGASAPGAIFGSRNTLAVSSARGLVPGGPSLHLTLANPGLSESDDLPDTLDVAESLGFDTREAYLEWSVPQDAAVLKGMTLKAGQFWTLLGGSVWTDDILGGPPRQRVTIPSTHVGLLAEYPVSDSVVVTGGLVHSWGHPGAQQAPIAGIGGITWTPRYWLTVVGTGLWGSPGFDADYTRTRMADVTATVVPFSPLTLLLDYDCGRGLADGERAGTETRWQHLALVGSYAVGPRTAVSIHGRWVDEHTGGDVPTPSALWDTGIAADSFLTPALTLRLEYRHAVVATGARSGSGVEDDHVGLVLTHTFD
jgi:hypothetical protein